MKNVLQFIGSFHQGGSERQAVQLTKLLVKDKSHKIFVAALNDEGILRSEIEELGFTEIPEFKLTSFYDLNFFKQLRKCTAFLRENKIDVVHTHDFYTNVFGIAAAKLAGVSLKIASKRETGGMRSASQTFIENNIFKIADKIVVNSAAVKKYLDSQNVDSNKVEIIYNGLDLQRLAPKTTNRREICEMLGLPAEENIKFITMVANLRHAVKNQPMFIKTAQKVCSEFPNVHFVLAGEGDLKAELENLVRQFGIEENSHLIGRCVNIPELLAVSYACVLTSFNEGFSNSILEYMTAGKPVVATDVGGAAEAVVENETGFLVASDDVEKMAEKLKILVADEQKAGDFGRQARTLAVEKFSTENQLRQTLKLYEN